MTKVRKRNRPAVRKRSNGQYSPKSVITASSYKVQATENFLNEGLKLNEQLLDATAHEFTESIKSAMCLETSINGNQRAFYEGAESMSVREDVPLLITKHRIANVEPYVVTKVNADSTVCMDEDKKMVYQAESDVVMDTADYDSTESTVDQKCVSTIPAHEPENNTSAQAFMKESQVIDDAYTNSDHCNQDSSVESDFDVCSLFTNNGDDPAASIRSNNWYDLAASDEDMFGLFVDLSPSSSINCLHHALSNDISFGGSKFLSTVNGRLSDSYTRIMDTKIFDGNAIDSILPCGITGLCNMGNTCYFNASMQALSNCTPLSAFFRSSESLAPFASLHCEGSVDVEPPVSRAFRMLLDSIWLWKKVYVNPLPLITQFRIANPQFRVFMQQDAQEFIRFFLDTLHQELKQPIYRWEIRDCISQYASKSDIAVHRARSDTQSSRTAENNLYPCDSSVSSSGSLSPTETSRYETADSGCSSEADPVHSSSSPTYNRMDLDAAGVNEVSISSKAPVGYRSIICDVFDGELCSTVKCLTCNQLSDSCEVFQDISLSVPSKKHSDRASHHSITSSSSIGNKNDRNVSKKKLLYPTATYFSIGIEWIIWLSSFWLFILHSYFFEAPVTLLDALNAFFTPDHLQGENMYSCERCATLRDGVKTCRITRLPQVLCIHLKRFRHGSSSSSKITTRVNFPLHDLDLSSFLSPSALESNKTALYDLCSFIVHVGSGIESGHYIAYCKNDVDQCWYEFDDSSVTKVETADVLTREPYVLFYRKRDAFATIQAKKELKKLTRRSEYQKKKMKFPSAYYISREWLHRLSTFSYPGVITNHDFMCQHGQISPRHAKSIASYCATIDADSWNYLHKKFGGGPVCSQLHCCSPCLRECFYLYCKRRNEQRIFHHIQKRIKALRPHYPHLLYEYYLPQNAIPREWMRRWIEFINCESSAPPPPIDNSSLLKCDFKTSLAHFNSCSQYIGIPRELWLYLLETYGGGPEVVCSSSIQSNSEEMKQFIDEINLRISEASSILEYSEQRTETEEPSSSD